MLTPRAMSSMRNSLLTPWAALSNLQHLSPSTTPTQLRSRPRSFLFCYRKVSFTPLLISSLDKLPQAAQSLLSLATPSPSPKYLPAKARVVAHWATLSEEQKVAAVKDDKVEKLKAIGLEDGLEKVAQEAAAVATKSIEHANEYVKLRMKIAKAADKFEELAIKALEADIKKGEKVKAIENLLSRLVKSGSDG